MFENNLLRKIFWAKRDEIAGEWRKLHSAELHALHSSPNMIVDPGGPVVIILATGSEVREFKPGRGRWIFSEGEILSMTSFGREVKPLVPCRRFTTRKRSSSRN